MAKKKSPKVSNELGRYKALSHMIGGFVHQLRTPIHVIHSTAESMTGPELELILRSADRLQATVDALLGFVKGEKRPLQPAPLNPVIEHLGDFLKAETQKRGVTLEKRLNAKFSISLDEYTLQEAILNLFMNALQAMPKGGTLTVSTDDVAGKNQVRLDIKDTGAGMDAKALAKLTSPFHTTKKGGVGLGVYFARQILQQHKAKIDFSSQKGRGTTVTILFPGV
jgi:signal transduction histidine kinase